MTSVHRSLEILLRVECRRATAGVAAVHEDDARPLTGFGDVNFEFVRHRYSSTRFTASAHCIANAS